MKSKTLALAAITALALSAHAQIYNWSMTTTDSHAPGNGDGTLTVTGGTVTAMSGTLGGGNVTLLAPGGYFGNDNVFPVNDNGISMNISGYGDMNLYYSSGYVWYSAKGTGLVVFSYAPVPEPATWATGGVFGLGALMTVAARRRRQAVKA